MKRKYFIFFISFWISLKLFSQGDPSVKNITFPLKITLENLEKKKTINKDHSRNLSIQITNTTDSSFSFSIMSCSWDWSIMFSPAIAYRDYWGCLKNIPETITLKSKESFILTDRFKLLDSASKKSVSISVGFKAVKPLPLYSGPDPAAMLKAVDKIFAQFEYDPKSTHKDYIWSKPISITF